MSGPIIARVRRGRARPGVAEKYNPFDYAVEIEPPAEKAMGVQTFHEDRNGEVGFVAISHRADVEAMAAFTGDPAAIHHLPRDAEFLVALPERVQVLRIRHTHGDLSGAR